MQDHYTHILNYIHSLNKGVVGVAQDVTESTKNDRAVAAMANELRQFVDKANGKLIFYMYCGNSKCLSYFWHL